jgi:membrane-associated phospholipid phosphatase
MTSSGREGDPYAGSWARRRLDLVVFVVAAVTVGVSAVVAAGGVSPLEATAFHAINDLPEALRPPLWLAQFFGGLLVPAAAAVCAALFRKWRLTLALLLLIPLKLLIEKGVIKELLFRARPGTSVCEGDLDCLNLRDVPAVGPSFPSGHVIIAFGIGWLVAPYLGRRGQWTVLALCLLVAFSRIYLGAHNPLDVVAGAASGIALAAALNLMLGVPRRAEV